MIPSILIAGLFVFQGSCLSIKDNTVLFDKLVELENRQMKYEQIYLEQQHLISDQKKTIDDLTQRVVQLEATRCKECEDKTRANNSTTDNVHDVIFPSIRERRQSFRRIAFSAYLDHSISHLGIDHPIPYNSILLNEGQTYSPSSGMFTCPMDGLYVFFFSTATNGINQSVAKLVVDGGNKVDAIADTYHTNHEAQGSNLVVLSLRAGQQVWVANYRWTDKSVQVSNNSRFATFSGFMLY